MACHAGVSTPTHKGDAMTDSRLHALETAGMVVLSALVALIVVLVRL